MTPRARSELLVLLRRAQDALVEIHLRLAVEMANPKPLKTDSLSTRAPIQPAALLRMQSMTFIVMYPASYETTS